MHFGQIKRREFITLLGGAAVAWPLTARAQQSMRQVGVLSNIGESDAEAQLMVALHESLRALGWMNGRNLQTDHPGRPAIRAALQRLPRSSWHFLRSWLLLIPLQT
jgi:hypothetical protein